MRTSLFVFVDFALCPVGALPNRESDAVHVIRVQLPSVNSVDVRPRVDDRLSAHVQQEERR